MNYLHPPKQSSLYKTSWIWGPSKWAALYSARLKCGPRLGKLYSCCCLNLWPVFACSIHTTWGPPFSRALYILDGSWATWPATLPGEQTELASFLGWGHCAWISGVEGVAPSAWVDGMLMCHSYHSLKYLNEQQCDTMQWIGMWLALKLWTIMWM